MKNFIVFDIMSASIRETGAWNDCKTIGAKREVHSVCVCLCYSMLVCTPQGTAEAQSVFCNYKFISRCPEEI